MQAFTKQTVNEPESPIDVFELLANPGFWVPFIVGSQEEKDYLLALQLLVGKRYEVCLDGVDEPQLDTPPTWVRIPGCH